MCVVVHWLYLCEWSARPRMCVLGSLPGSCTWVPGGPWPQNSIFTEQGPTYCAFSQLESVHGSSLTTSLYEIKSILDSVKLQFHWNFQDFQMELDMEVYMSDVWKTQKGLWTKAGMANPCYINHHYPSPSFQPELALKVLLKIIAGNL